LLSAIQEIPEEEYRNAFITAFSNSLEYNNMMTPYNYPHRKLHHLFNYHAMPLTTTPVENAVWGVSDEGAGTFVNCYKRYVNAKRYCQTPFDKFKNSRGEIHTVYAREEKIAAHFVSTFEELQQTPRGALLLCGDSSHLPAVPDKSVDFVMTDPPYFDNIHYSELSNFFYVWLSMLNKQHPYFRTDHVPTEKEAIVNEGMDKGEEDYQHLLASVFRECQRVLKDEGRLIFTFHHTKWRAWWTVLSAITTTL
jgi:putative DNA methylase